MPRVSNNLTTHGGVLKDSLMFPSREHFERFLNRATETFFDHKFPPLPPNASNLDRIEREEERNEFRKGLLKYTNDRLLNDQELVRKLIYFVTRCRKFSKEWIEFVQAHTNYEPRPATPKQKKKKKNQ